MGSRVVVQHLSRWSCLIRQVMCQLGYQFHSLMADSIDCDSQLYHNLEFECGFEESLPRLSGILVDRSLANESFGIRSKVDLQQIKDLNSVFIPLPGGKCTQYCCHLGCLPWVSTNLDIRPTVVVAEEDSPTVSHHALLPWNMMRSIRSFR